MEVIYIVFAPTTPVKRGVHEHVLPVGLERQPSSLWGGLPPPLIIILS